MIRKISTFFNNMSVGRKLSIGFGFLVTLTLLAGLITFVTSRLEDSARDKSAHIGEEVLLIERVQLGFLEARSSERAFLVNYQSEGLATATANYIIRYREQLQTLNSLLDEAQSLETAEEADDMSAMGGIDQALMRYDELFTDIVKDLGERGDLDTGQLGNVFDNFHTVANTAFEVGDSAIEAEARHTAEEVLEYVVSPSQELIDATFRHADALKTIIQASDLPTTEKNALLAQIDEGTAGFNQVTELDEDTAGERVELESVARSVTLAVEELLTDERSEQAEVLADLAAAQRLARTLNIAIVGAVVAAGAALALVITRSITHPINKLMAVADELTRGNLKARSDISQQSEMGDLGEAFNVMAGTIQQREMSLRNARDKARESTQLKSRFLANVSHELRTPLNGIIVFSDLSLRGVYGELSPMQRDASSRTLEAARRLLALIDTVLNISRIESDQFELDREEVNVSEVIDSVVAFAKHQADAKNLDLNYAISPDVPDSIISDRQRLTQIMQNLVDNAIKYTAQGSVSVNVDSLDENRIKFVVRDTGQGIPKTELENIFQEFYQVKDMAAQGAGLGLSICRSFTEAFGGTISVSSVVGLGSSFEVVIPAILSEVAEGV